MFRYIVAYFVLYTSNVLELPRAFQLRHTPLRSTLLMSSEANKIDLSPISKISGEVIILCLIIYLVPFIKLQLDNITGEQVFVKQSTIAQCTK